MSIPVYFVAQLHPHPIHLLIFLLPVICFKIPITRTLFDFPKRFQLPGVHCIAWNLLLLEDIKKFLGDRSFHVQFSNLIKRETYNFRIKKCSGKRDRKNSLSKCFKSHLNFSRNKTETLAEFEKTQVPHGMTEEMQVL